MLGALLKLWRMLADMIQLLFRNLQLAADFGKNGRKRVAEAFSMEPMIHEYQSIYEELFQYGH